MKKLNAKIKFVGLASLLSVAGLVTSCGSYQNNSYYENDGIYNSNSSRNRVVSTQSVDPNINYNKYQEFFSEGKDDFTVFTDVDNYTSASDSIAINNQSYNYNQQNLGTNDYYGNWGQNSSNVTVNVYDSGYPYYGGYYSSWGWYRPYYRMSWGWGWPYYDPFYGGMYAGYYGWGWNSPYYGGYYGGYYGNYYRPNVIRTNGNRVGVVRNNTVSSSVGRNSINRNSGIRTNTNTVRNTVGTSTRNFNTNTRPVNQVTTIRENGQVRQAVIRDPQNIIRSQNSGQVRNNVSQPNYQNNTIRNNNYQNNQTRQTTPRSQSIDRSSSPSRSYTPSSSPSRGGNFGGGSFGGGSRGGSSGGVGRR